MSIELRKYVFADLHRTKNYFDSPTLLSTITQTKIKSFPLYNEEYQDKLDSFDFLTGDFNIVFNLTEAGIESFFTTNLDNHCIACKIDIGGKSFGGLVDIASIDLDYSIGDGMYQVECTVYNWRKEVKAFATGSITPPNNFKQINFWVFESLNNHFFRNQQGRRFAYLYFKPLMDWETRVGYHPVVVSEIIDMLESNGRLDNVTSWSLFEDLCRGFGLVYRFIFDQVQGGDYFAPTMEITFRDEGFDSNNLTLNYANRRHGYLLDTNVNDLQLVKYMARQPSGGSQAVDNTIIYGTVFDALRATTTDGYVYSLGGGLGEEQILINDSNITLNKLNDPFPFDLSRDKVNVLEFQNYFDMSYQYSNGYAYYIFTDSVDGFFSSPQVLQIKYLSFPRMFTKQGYTTNIVSFLNITHRINKISHSEGIHELFYNLVENTVAIAYQYLVKGFKKTMNANINLLNNFNVNVYDTTLVNGTQYQLMKISAMEFEKQIIESAWVEV